MTRILRKTRGQRGQAMVEFVLVLPLLLIVLFGIVEFGIAYKNYLSLTDAARAGARKAAVNRTAADPVAAADQAVRASAADLDQSKLDVNVTPPPWTAGGDVTVEASYPFSIDILGVVVKSGRLTTTVTERVE